MIPMTVGDIATVVGAPTPPGDPTITLSSVEFDSRRIQSGALFVALPGDHVDGHDFAAAAAGAGARAMLSSRPSTVLPTLVVGDVVAALAALAAHVARQLMGGGLTIIGITGSAGKTSTKDLTAAVLSRAGSVVAPPGSFNNELGHPYTVLRADADTDYLVLELSARGIGHIAALAAVAPPRIGAVLNVGSAHLGEFGSRDAIAVAKGELVEALPTAVDGGIAVLNADDARVAAMASRTEARTVFTGCGDDAEVRADDVMLDESACARFTLTTPEGSAPVALSVAGEHQVPNALAAAAIGRAVGMDVTVVADAFSAAGPASPWRMAVTDTPGPAGMTVINDAYNANPESMRAALAALAHIGAGRRRWAILGQMAELGDSAAAAHDEIGRVAADSGAAVLAVGEGARGVADGAAGAEAGVHWVPDIDAALALLRASLRPGDAVLVKASRSVGLERLAARLIDEWTPGGVIDESNDPRGRA